MKIRLINIAHHYRVKVTYSVIILFLILLQSYQLNDQTIPIVLVK
ncbi:MAG: hypothetical protein ACI82Z_001353 [Cellvibrionaceae bacterium]|jgi:hypothetical protein